MNEQRQKRTLTKIRQKWMQSNENKTKEKRANINSKRPKMRWQWKSRKKYFYSCEMFFVCECYFGARKYTNIGWTRFSDACRENGPKFVVAATLLHRWKSKKIVRLSRNSKCIAIVKKEKENCHRFCTFYQANKAITVDLNGATIVFFFDHATFSRNSIFVFVSFVYFVSELIWRCLMND